MERTFKIETFIQDVLCDKYALVVGNEIILDTKIEPSGDVHTFFLKKVNEITNSQYTNFHDIALGLKEDSANPIRQLFDQGLLKDDDVTLVSPQLLSLLKTKLFTTVLTTTTDGFLEAAMKTVWPNEGELRIVNIYDKKSINDFRDAIKSCRKGQIYSQPTLIYVFGKMDKENWSVPYVRTEAEAVAVISRWISMNEQEDNQMLRFIKQKRLLALGCKYDNWYFRFFWYILTGETDRKNFYGSGEVAFFLDTTEKSEKSLQKYLDHMCICRLDDANTLIQEITRTLTEESNDAPFRHLIEKNRRNGGVFISYSSKDALPACQLFAKLKQKYNVWLDNARLYGGDDYEKGIENAISSSQIIITLLSPNVAADYPFVLDELSKERNDRIPFYTKEWLMAKQFDDKTIIPLAINGYNLRAEYHHVYESIIGQTNSGINADDKINLMETDGFSKLLNSIDNHLK